MTFASKNTKSSFTYRNTRTACIGANAQETVKQNDSKPIDKQNDEIMILACAQFRLGKYVRERPTSE